MRVFLLGVALATACAHSSGRETSDGPGSSGGGSDAAVSSDASPDAMKKGFGDPCTDSMQCASDICILVGTGGVCTELCGQCPDGWGCFGVLGATDPDQ